jgi:hypothetical protein
MTTVDGRKTEGKEENDESLQNGGILGGARDQNATVQEPTPKTIQNRLQRSETTLKLAQFGTDLRDGAGTGLL